LASIAAHPAEVYVAAADEQDANDLLVGLTEFTVKDSTTVLDISHMSDTTGYKKRMSGLTDVSISLSCVWDATDAPQLLLHVLSSTSVYCSILPDGTNGYAYPCLIESYEVKGEIDGLIEFSASLVGNGAKVAKS